MARTNALSVAWWYLRARSSRFVHRASRARAAQTFFPHLLPVPGVGNESEVEKWQRSLRSIGRSLSSLVLISILFAICLGRVLSTIRVGLDRVRRNTQDSPKYYFIFCIHALRLYFYFKCMVVSASNSVPLSLSRRQRRRPTAAAATAPRQVARAWCTQSADSLSVCTCTA